LELTFLAKVSFVEEPEAVDLGGPLREAIILFFEEVKRRSSSSSGWFVVEMVVEWLWEILAEMNSEYLNKWFYFVTNRKRLPPTGIQDLTPPVSVKVDPTAPPDSLPQSSTW
jgi:hypothetical protein